MKTDVIEQVIQDLELEQKGATLYYAVDPFDLVTFCFPIDPKDSTLRSLDDIADEQAALYEVTLAREPHPILLSEYVDEVDSIFRYLERHTVDAFYKTATIERLMGGVRSNHTSLEDAANLGLKDIEDPAQFNVVIAVVMGIYSLGIQRFRDICQRVSTPSRADISQIIGELNNEYQESEQTEFFRQQMLSLVPHKEQTAEIDARAIDRLFFINAGLERAALTGRLSNRHIVIYLSSAHRSLELFATPSMQARFPVIAGKKYSILRRPEHVFNTLVSRGSSDEASPAAVDKAIRQLKETLKLLQWDRANRLNRKFSPHIQQHCARCIQDGALERDCSTCPSLNNCKAVLGLGELYNQQRVRTIQNLGLMSVVERYHELRNAQARSPNESRFLQYFKHVAEDSMVRKRAMERITEYHVLIRVQLDFKSFLCTQRGEERLARFFARRLLYLFLPDLASELTGTSAYDELLSALQSSERALTASEVLLFYDNAINAFVSIDGAKERVSELHELFRCIVYLDCPTDAGDRLAFDHAQEMLDTYQRSMYRRHFWIVLSLVAPRLLRFDAGEWYANEGLSKYPADPRLHHARAVNAIRLLKSQPMLDKRDEKLRLAIEEQTASIGLCSDDAFKRLRAVGWNNLAYYYCFDDWRDDFDESQVRLARESLNRMKEVIPKDQWDQEDISFFHTEALVELYEARVARRASALDHALYKLECARREIVFATQRVAKESYRNLLRLIDSESKAIKELKIGRAVENGA